MMRTRGFSIGLLAAGLIACTGTLGGEAAPDGPTGGTSSAGGATSTGGAAGTTSTAGTGNSAGTVGDAGTAGGPVEPAYPFEPTTARSAIGKVKNALTGLAPTDDEVASVEKDTTALGKMIDSWFITPEAQLKMRGFYANAFQQSQVIESDLGAQLTFAGTNNFLGTRVLQSVRESFPRTVQAMVAAKQPFTDAITTHVVHLNPALMAFYVMADDVLMTDDNKRSRRHPTKDGQLRVTFEYLPADKGGPITLAQALDPKNEHYMHFPMDAAYVCQVPKVDATNHVIYDSTTKKPTYDDVSFNALPFNVSVADNGVEMKLFQRLTVGGVAGATGAKDVLPANLTPPDDVPLAQKGDYNVKCPFTWNSKPLLTEDDFKWRPVTIETRDAGDETGHVAFWDLPTLRLKDKLRLRTPRVGFFSTPAFLGTFPTNQSNQARVTANQTLIVALGRSINPVDKGASTVLDTGKDGSHSDPDSPCYSCHQTMDPFRNVFLKTWTYSYSQQMDANHLFLSSVFDFGGVKENVASLEDLAKLLIAHPLYPSAVAQKLCYYANSAACSEDDPEFLRVVKAFTDSKFDFQTLVRELFSSPLITGLTETKTLTDRGEVVSIARYNHLCASLTNRLGLVDNLCSGTAPAAAPKAVQDKAKAIAVQLATNIPSDGFARGAEGPLLPTNSTMFFRSASESLCLLAADFAVDVPGSRYDSTKKDQAIGDFVSNIMGLTATDPAREPATAILQAHYDKAIAAKASASDALKSTFTLACTSPTSVTLGL